ncbi:hypothetical protein Lpp17_0136 [Lacticaseibacillus paracasei subsp. paracasei Lpp17]|nr:hypothetical protein Lpp17_0136 [Lacticaseibacillus paracasei subsp. paracasei Lpp17]
MCLRDQNVNRYDFLWLKSVESLRHQPCYGVIWQHNCAGLYATKKPVQ